MVELVDRLHQPEIALLDEVEELHASADISLGDGDDEPEVGFAEALFRLFVALGHPLGEVLFLFGGQKRHLSDIFEIHLDRVVGRAVQRVESELFVERRRLFDGHARLFDAVVDVFHLGDVEVEPAEFVVDLLVGQLTAVGAGDELGDLGVDLLFARSLFLLVLLLFLIFVHDLSCI